MWVDFEWKKKTYFDLSWVTVVVERKNETGRTVVRKSKRGEVATKKKNIRRKWRE